MTLLLTRHYGRQFKALPSLTDHPAEFEEKVLALIRYGESPNLEFKSTLRTNLKTGKAGKEIELAWLKSVVGFLNTDGGVLLIGVNDGGEVVGIAADQFENDDKCLLHFKNLINQHIGAEFSKYLHAEIVQQVSPCRNPPRRRQDAGGGGLRKGQGTGVFDRRRRQRGISHPQRAVEHQAHASADVAVSQRALIGFR